MALPTGEDAAAVEDRYPPAAANYRANEPVTRAAQIARRSFDVQVQVDAASKPRWSVDDIRGRHPTRGSRRNSLRNTLCDLRDGCAAASECTLDGGP